MRDFVVKITLVIMAAGIGSRYGGIKQLEAVGPTGEIIIDYSIYDAIKAGFEKIVFIIRRDIEKEFKRIIGNRISAMIETEYVYQDINALPLGFKKPLERVKPWGTGHAVLACKDVIDGPFAVINSDDYYGSNAFSIMYQYLSTLSPFTLKRNYHYCMAGYILRNTLSPYGCVTRGICQVNSNNQLARIIETSGIEGNNSYAVSLDPTGKILPISLDSITSMNMWGFTPNIFRDLEEGFITFLTDLESNSLVAEYLLPNIMNELIKSNKAQISVLKTADQWIGVTHKEDKPLVINKISKLIEDGIYLSPLYSQI